MLLFEPCDKLGRKIYRCDKRFHLDNVTELYRNPIGSIGCVFTDGKVIKFNIIEPMNQTNFKSRQLYSSTMKLIGKTRKGGSSSARYGRIRENQRKNNVSKIADKVMDYYYDADINKSMVDLLIICGPGTLKSEIGTDNDMQKIFSVKVHSMDHLNLIDINEKFVGELVDIKNSRILVPQKALIMNPDSLIIGEREIKAYIEQCNIKEIYVNNYRLFERFTKETQHGPEIIIVENSQFLDSLGGFVGIKYY